MQINRVKNLDWIIKYGSNWVSITDDLVTVILKKQDKITHLFSYTNCADELFIQTVAYNCGFKKRIYQPEFNQTANLRFIDWSRGKNGNLYTFQLSDKDMLIPKRGGKQNKNLFARKFSESVDKEIINAVLLKLKNERN